MARKIRPPKKLTQQDDSWGVIVRQMRVWVNPPDEAPSRPYIMLVFNMDIGIIQRTQTFEVEPEPDEIGQILFEAMKQPPPGVGQKPHRPGQVVVETADLAGALRHELNALNVAVSVNELSMLDDMILDLEEHLRGGPEPDGLLSVKGVTPELAGGLFAAAAAFYRAEPWIHLADRQTLAIRVSSERRTRYAQVMGQAGMTYGLAMYRNWKDVERLFSFVDHPLETLPPRGGHSFTYDEITHLPFADLEALEKFGWEVAGEQAYPTPFIFTREGTARRPSAADLRWYEAALYAIPIFLREHLSPGDVGDYQPAEATLQITTHQGVKEVYLKYPGGALPRETRPAHMTDWSALDEDDDFEDEAAMPAYDRRAMEGIMAQIGAPPFEDPALQAAQEKMYKAWEEQNPARRIILAHEALDISPLCADAYVLLAEEEADTVGREMAYYRQGVEAGEKALGAAYFEEYEGHFWGLLETRPYMRAREGLANCLWQLDRLDEAVDHFRDMLRLNPHDNQGLRYSLLNLLLNMERNAEARTVIQTFEEDGMAEWTYGNALLTFKENGPGLKANRALREALSGNAFIPDYLLGRKRIPRDLPDYIGWGDENEAISYASNHLALWRRAPGAIDWLKDRLQPTSRSKRKKPKRGR
jgi:tetratricopeptide (TPR) repeat protein